jgi:hypothetical protein
MFWLYCRVTGVWKFLERESEIAFNAGRLDRSLLNSADYPRIVCQTAASIVSS